MAATPSVTDTAVEQHDLVAKLWQTIDALPPQRRAVAYLRWREGMDYDEIASVTGQSVAAVKMQVSRTLAALRTAIPGLME